MSKKIKQIILLLFVGANILDFVSTITQSPIMEENPVVRYIWQNFGDIGLILCSILTTLLSVWIVYKFDNVLIYIWLGILSIFIILIGLTNLALVPIGWTSWLVFPQKI